MAINKSFSRAIMRILCYNGKHVLLFGLSFNWLNCGCKDDISGTSLMNTNVHIFKMNKQ